MWWRRSCKQTRRRRQTMVPLAGPELKISQEYRKVQWHHLQRVSNMSCCKTHILVWVANGRRDHATCARRVTNLGCASHAQQDRILMIPSRFGCVRMAFTDANAIANICTRCWIPVSRIQHFCDKSTLAEALFIEQFLRIETHGMCWIDSIYIDVCQTINTFPLNRRRKALIAGK